MPMPHMPRDDAKTITRATIQLLRNHIRQRHTPVPKAIQPRQRGTFLHNVTRRNTHKHRARQKTHVTNQNHRHPPTTSTSQYITNLLRQYTRSPTTTSHPVPFTRARSHRRHRVRNRQIPSTKRQRAMPHRSQQPRGRVIAQPTVRTIGLRRRPKTKQDVMHRFHNRAQSRAVTQGPNRRHREPKVRPSQLPRQRKQRPSGSADTRAARPSPTTTNRDPARKDAPAAELRAVPRARTRSDPPLHRDPAPTQQLPRRTNTPSHAQGPDSQPKGPRHT